MNRILIIALLLAGLGGTAALAQEPPAEAGEQPPAEEEPAPAEELPEIDVWEDAEADDDVFVPTESISADASIAFPSDI